MTVSFGKKVVYALGQLGLVLCAYGAGKLFLTFYTPNTAPFFANHIHQAPLFGLFTVAGLAIALGQIADAGASLASGWLSDRALLKHGRRTGFMLFSAVPVAFASFMVFFLPSTNLTVNSVYLVVITLIFYTLLSFYATPYLALLAEIGKTRQDRMVLSILMGVATATASLLGNRIFTLADLLRRVTTLSPSDAFKSIIAVYALVAAVCMLLPAFLIKEKENEPFEPVRDSFRQALSVVGKDKHFQSYLLADSMFRIASALFIAGFSWFVTVLLKLDQRAANLLLLTVFFSNLALFYPVFVLVQIVGKRKMLFIAYVLFMVALIASVFAGLYPIDPWFQGMVLAFMLSIPYAVFSVVPNALVADLAVAAERKTGEKRGGMYFAIHTLIVKSGVIIAGLLFPLFIVFSGSSLFRQPKGIGLRLVLICAAVFSLVGFFALFGYHEKQVSAVLGDRD